MIYLTNRNEFLLFKETLREFIRNLKLYLAHYYPVKEIFQEVIRNLIFYLTYHYPKIADLLILHLERSRYNFAIDKIRWKRNTHLLAFIGSTTYFYLYIGEYEKNEINFLQKILKEGDVFIDIGANIGIYTILAGKLVGEEGTVYAFEPSKREFELLLKNIRLNKLSNIIPVKAAISDYTGYSKLLIAGGVDTGMNTLASTFYKKTIPLYRFEEVPVYKLDDFVNRHNLNKITLIKIDVEGYDLFALKGMRNTLAKSKPIIMLEISEQVLQNAGCNSEQIFSFLKECEYEIFYYDIDGNLTKNIPQYTREVTYYNIVCIHKKRHN